MTDTSLEVPFDNRVIDGEDRMLRDELAAVGTRREAARELHENLQRGAAGEGPYTVGLALSGGGIRSATVSLGIMQKLAGADFLRHVDYLSTVSGGGYIGSALTWWLRGNAKGEPADFDTGEHFPFGTTDPSSPEPVRGPGPDGTERLTPLQYLRVQGNYLIPGNGLTIWSAIAVVARAILLNLMIWIPVAALVIGLIYALGRLPFLKGLPFAVRMAAPGALEAAGDVVGSSGQVEVNQTIPPAFLLMLVLAIVLFALFVAGSVVHSFLSWTNLRETQAPRRARGEPEPPRERVKWYSWLLVGLVAVAGLLLFAVIVLWVHPAVENLFAHKDVLVRKDMPELMRGIGLWIVLVAATVAAIAIIGRRDLAHAFKGENPKAVGKTLAALLVMLGAAYLAHHLLADDKSLLARIPELVLFIYAVSYLAFLVYLVGLLIRHILRAQAVGSPQAEMRVPTPSLLEYRARRAFEWFYGRTLFWTLVLLVIGSLPLVSGYIQYGLGSVWTALGLVVTLAGNVISRWRGNSRLTEIMIIAGAALFAYGILLIGHRLAVTFMDGDVTARALIAAAVIMALIGGWFVNTNHIGLHRFYRDRLMEAFLPDADSLCSDVNAPANAANERTVVNSWSADWSKGPYQIVNTNVVLTNSPERKYRLRGGDNFILTPKFLGSNATGWYRPEDTANGDMTLASAMAISGAAANPRGAAGGRGVTRSPFVALVMSLLNIRLGYWIPNPRYGKPRLLLRRPNHFWPGGAYAATSGGYTEKARWLEIADGGHFENLAIYELVRRRCGLIIVCDGGQDIASSYHDLVVAAQRVAQDFGATVHFDMQVKKSAGDEFVASSPAQMIADAKLTDYPKGAEFAEKGYFVGRIDYGKRGGRGWPESGILIYMKSALIKSMAISAKGYRGAHHDFPNETTGDQFFDEEQFEAYREVGYRICEQMMTELDLAHLFEKKRPLIGALRKNGRFQKAPAT